MQKRLMFLVASCTVLASALPGWSAEIHGRSSTQFQSFTNELNDHRQVELGEYLRIAVTNIDKEGKFSLYGYGRMSQALTNGDGFNSRLYYLYGDYRDLFGKIDIKAGRQFVSNSAGGAIIDGAQVDLKNIGPLAFSVLGGRDVLFGLNNEIGDRTNTVLGLSTYLYGFKHTDADFSWYRKWDGGDIARDILGGSFKQYLFNSVRLYGNAKYDLTAEAFNEALAGIKYYPLSNLILTGEYYHSYATFDTTSIYSVFAVNNYSEGLFRVEYSINDAVSVHGGYTRESFGDGGAANVYNAGVGIRPFSPLRVNVEFDDRTGYYGSTTGWIVDAAYDLGKSFQVDGGITYDVYQRDAITHDEIARRYWLGGKYRLAGNMALSGRIQDDVNARYTSNVSGRVTFDYDF